MRSIAAMKIDEALTVGLTCLQEGIDNKNIVKKNILEAVFQNSFPVQEVPTLEELPVEVFELFHKQLGLGFHIHNGKITGVFIESKEIAPAFEEKFERLQTLLDIGIDFSSRSDNTVKILCKKH